MCGNHIWELYEKGKGKNIKKFVTVNVMEEIKEREMVEKGLRELREKYALHTS